MAPDPYRYFRLEARDLLDQLAKGVLDLEKFGNGAGEVQLLLRLAHTLKGAARVIRQPEVADRAHAIEEALSPFRESGNRVGRKQIDAVLRHLDEIGGRVAALDSAEDENRPPRPKAAGEESARTVRADIAEMDVVLDGVSATHAILNGFRTAAQSMEQTRHLADLLIAQMTLRSTSGSGRPAEADPQHLFSVAEEVRRRFVSVERTIGSVVDQMDRELRQLRDAAEQLRLVSAETLFTTLERAMRDVAQALSKRVTFEGKGGHIRLDSHVLETIQAALAQIVRNSVAHGIESTSDRRAAGKPEVGRVTIEVARRGRRIAFVCSDDGRGLNLEAVRDVAVQRGLAAANSRQLGAEELIGLLLRGGISTSADVTEVSGRGIGLDVVRATIDRLRGDVAVRTDPGRGTTIELLVPPSLTSLDALMVEASGVVTAIPLDAARRSLRLGANEISRATVLHNGEAIPFVPIAQALGGKRPAARQNWTAVVVAAAGGMAVVGVDRLLGTARVVARPLPEHMQAGSIVAGAWLDAEGNPQLVLDPDELVAVAQRQEGAEPEAPPPDRPVLVVDDSLTTRMLERSILESAGYCVDVAQSGEEALEIARRKRYALFLVDVEMPGIDGFTFVERIRSDPALHEIPAILVTSRSTPEDFERGRSVGAQGYVVKSEFDQARLLAMIRPLAG
jgi:two-component system, chemotaxis family, sensor kinase CheA